MDNNRSAAGLRRSAIAERVRLQAEWAELKGTDVTCNALRGVVALVEVGAGSRALALRAALSALGATIVSNWVPLVTHVIWAEGGCRKVRAKARALACQLVSPVWVEACAAAARRLPERAFPSATRPSDLPSPAALRRMLKIAEKENIPLNVLPTKPTQDNPQKLRISSDTSADKSTDTSMNTSTETDVESRVNTAPRRAMKGSTTSPVPVKKSRRKLFTHKEVMESGSDDNDETKLAPVRPRKATRAKITQRDRRDLARAERMARRLANPVPTKTTQGTQPTQDIRPRIVLTGMTSSQRKNIFEAVIKLGGRVQKEVNKKTTHVVLGSCCDDVQLEERYEVAHVERNEFGVCDNDITGIESLTLNSPSILRSQLKQDGGQNNAPESSTAIKTNAPVKPRTLNALEGAARGCRILNPDWVINSLEQGKWLHHIGYEVPHLKKMSQKARIDRQIQHRNRKEYAYDVFCDLLVQISDDAEQKHAAMTLLKLCGAKILEKNFAFTPDVRIGRENGQVSSKWVFDSVAAARIRTTRRYVIRNAINEAQSEIDAILSSNHR